MNRKVLFGIVFGLCIAIGLLLRFLDEINSPYIDLVTWIWAVIFLIGGVLLFDLLSWIIKLFK